MIVNVQTVILLLQGCHPTFFGRGETWWITILWLIVFSLLIWQN